MIFSKMTRNRIFKASAFLLSRPWPLVAPARRSFIPFIALKKMVFINSWIPMNSHRYHHSPSGWENSDPVLVRHVVLGLENLLQENCSHNFFSSSHKTNFSPQLVTRPLRVNLTFRMITNVLPICYRKVCVLPPKPSMKFGLTFF